jgi:tetratricopeptide (TPR) repeat protein
VIDFSWRLLGPEHQEVIAALSTFRGGFTRDAAAHVAQASLRALSTLVDKALVRRSADSRYSLHPLVRAFAAEKLAASRHRRTIACTRHADHYVRLLCAQRHALNGPEHAAARQSLERDLDNVRAAWQWKVDTADADAVRDSARPLSLTFDRLGLYDEWTRTLERALDAFPSAVSEASSAAERQLLICAANGHWRRGDVARADTYRARILAAIGDARTPAELAELHKLSGLIARDAGNFDLALENFTAAAAAAADAGDLVVQMHVANEIGVLHFRRGDFDRARAAFEDSLEKCDAGNNVYDAPLALHNVAYCDLEMGRFDEAEAGLGRAWQLFRERADARAEAMVLSSLGILARRRGDLGRARELAAASLSLAERVGNLGAIADATDDLAQVVEKLGDLREAQSLYARALAMSRELGQVHLQCFVLLHLARAQCADRDQVASARSLSEALQLAIDHDFQSGRLMALLGAAGLRAQAADSSARSIATGWCRAALAVAGPSVDVRDAMPSFAEATQDEPPARPSPTLDESLTDALRFLRGVTGAPAIAQGRRAVI